MIRLLYMAGHEGAQSYVAPDSVVVNKAKQKESNGQPAVVTLFDCHID